MLTPSTPDSISSTISNRNAARLGRRTLRRHSVLHRRRIYEVEAAARSSTSSLGETDDWAHAGQYTEYLDSAHRVDAYLRAIWELAQSMPEYRGNTTLIFSPDHGRGKAPKKWRDHGQKIPDSKYIWMMLSRPRHAVSRRACENRTGHAEPNRGDARGISSAKTTTPPFPKAGKPIADVLRH